MKTLLVLALVPFLSLQIKQAPATSTQFVVTGAKVVFFGPTQAEQDSIVRMEGLETAQLFDDFDYYAGKASAFLRMRRIAVEHTTAAIIVVGLDNKRIRKIDRRTTPDALGVILTDGIQEPRLIAAGFTDEELISDCREFFGLK